MLGLTDRAWTKPGLGISSIRRHFSSHFYKQERLEKKHVPGVHLETITKGTDIF